MKSSDLNWIVLPDANAVAEDACDLIIKTANECIEKHGRFSIVLTGGRTPQKTYQLLTQKQTDWSKWFVYLGDERCLPVDDSERNSQMAEQYLISQVPIPGSQYFAIAAEKGAKQAASIYSKLISKEKSFDLVLLGMGEDGHIASLFPGQQHNQAEQVHAVFESPKPPSERVSMSKSALENSRQILFMITGAEKAVAVKAWRQGQNLPVSQIKTKNGVVLIDQDAMG